MIKQTNEEVLIDRLSDFYDLHPEISDSIYDEAISTLDSYNYDDVDMLDEHVWVYFCDSIMDSMTDKGHVELISLDDESFKKEVSRILDQDQLMGAIVKIK